MQRFNNPITETESFHHLDVYFSLEHIKCTSDEKWRIIPDFSRYQASTSGRIRDAYTMEFIKQNFCSKQHYNRVTLTGDDGKRGPQFVHRLVAKAFASLPLTNGDGWYIDHINHNGEDNRPCNLRAISATANANNKRNQTRYWYEELLMTVPLIFARRYGVRVTLEGKTLPAYSRLLRFLKKFPDFTFDAALLITEEGHPQYTHPEFIIA
ncbi:hypothetical protein J2X66_000377 [Pseudomonas sp. 3296]|uniref:HNH endonuclease n=1 Tax=Pseudomonas sp. 3296 TaxID=2817753 RepID=UPI002865C36D|nr:NUMOD4 domain-containing protein [Pseudomonas sp. 3296]MDR6913530.1 hypothetical protein [Pseudomonas sp. 3296]